MRTASPSFDFETSLLCWDMTNPQFPSRRFMIMKWSCLTGYQNFMESRPPSFPPALSHLFPTAAPEAWSCHDSPGRLGIVDWHLTLSISVKNWGYNILPAQKWCWRGRAYGKELLSFSKHNFLCFWGDKNDFPRTAANQIRRNLNL